MEDVAFVLTHKGIPSTPFDSHVEDIYMSLNLDSCERAALEADNVNDQTELAYKEIERQLNNASIV